MIKKGRLDKRDCWDEHYNMCDMKGLMMGREREILEKVGMELWGTHVGMGKTTWAGGQTFGSLGDKSELCWLLAVEVLVVLVV